MFANFAVFFIFVQGIRLAQKLNQSTFVNTEQDIPDAFSGRCLPRVIHKTSLLLSAPNLSQFRKYMQVNWRSDVLSSSSGG
jgi:hypothetical protein